MIIHISTIQYVIRGGAAIRVPRLHLAGHGYDADAAMRDLNRALNAWALGLAAKGCLEDALDRLHIQWSREGNGMTFVDETTEQVA